MIRINNAPRDPYDYPSLCLDKEEVINVRTREQDKRVRDKLTALGFTWCLGKPFNAHSYWHQNMANTCINPKAGSYSRIGFYEGQGSRIVTAIKWFERFN